MTITLNGTTGITLPNGSASTPAETGTDTDSGVFYGTNTVSIATGGTTAVTVDSSQNVGIGTSSPTQKLDIASGGKIYLRRSDNGTGGTIHDGGAGSGGLIFNELNSEGFAWQLGSTEKMRIDSSGNLLVGTTNAQTGSVCFSFDGAVKYGLILDNTSTIGSGQFVQRFRQNGAFVGSIQTTSTATFYVTSSDYRLKENIAPMTGALAKVQALKPVTYTWKSTGEASQGFIAHELQAVVPDCVTGEKDAVDAEGNPEYQGIDTSFLVATLTAAIQELKAQLDESNLILTSVKTELDTVKTELATLKGTA